MLKERIESIISSLDKKRVKKLRLELLVRIAALDLNDPEVDRLLGLMVRLLDDEYPTIKKEYFANHNLLLKHLENEYDMHPEGSIREKYTGIGIAIGIALGSPMVVINPAFMSLGLPIGLAIGAAIGDRKEKEAKEKGKII